MKLAARCIPSTCLPAGIRAGRRVPFASASGHGRAIPEILTSGNHEKVRQWRRKQSLRRTRERRPDMYEKLDLTSKQDQKLLKEMEAEDAAGKTMG